MPNLSQGLLFNYAEPLIGEHKDIRFAQFSPLPNQICKTLLTQLDTAEFSTLKSGIPKARASRQLLFRQLAAEVEDESSVGIEEKALWELAAILFDDEGEVYNDYEKAAPIRKERLARFWRALVRKDAEKDVRNARSHAEKAFIWLTCGDVEEACAALLEGKNFHLATIVAQLPGDGAFRSTISKQIDAWMQLNSLSEFDDHIRALYEIAAGNVRDIRGKAGAVEDTVHSFSFAQRFNLDWRRIFGLRLWYASELPDTDIVVQNLWDDIEHGAEMVKPVPRFIQDRPIGNDAESDSREDPLWSLLKLFAGLPQTDVEGSRLALALEPDNISGSPMDARLAWQLGQLLFEKRIGTSETDPNGSEEDRAVVDKLTITFAESLARLVPTRADALNTATWVLMHLSNASAIEQSIRSLLNLNAPQLHPDQKFLPVLSHSKTSKRWEFAAKALYAHAIEHDPVAEAKYLVQAGQWDEAHGVVVDEIGPTAIIEQDYDGLRDVLGYLMEEHKRSSRDLFSSAEWERGGGLFFDFVELCDHEGVQGANRNHSQINNLAHKVTKTLERLGRPNLDGMTKRQRIAIQMMSVKAATNGSKQTQSVCFSSAISKYAFADLATQTHGANVLKLPFTSDRMLSSARTLAIDYFKALTRAKE